MNNSLADELKARAAAMNRRQQNSTDSSGVSVTSPLADAIHENAKLLEKLSFSSPEVILNRAFSTTSTLSTTSTFPMEQQKASTDDKLQIYRLIGFGRCGYVFELMGTGEVAKVAVNEDGIEVWVECCMHQKIRESLGKAPQGIALCHIPTAT
jgi:hypothetical protein